MRPTRAYANLVRGQTHFRRLGKGSPVLLLHPSPLSSAFLVPLMHTLAERCDVIAPDTPGYGQSDPLDEGILQADQSLVPYVDWLAEFLQELQLPEVVIYGSATGAQIGIEFSKRHPDFVRHLVLDNAAHFEPSEVDQIKQRYFPSLAPKSDGSHFADAWQMAEALFQWFPWYAQDDAHRVAEHAPPAEVVHATALAYLNSGPDYAQAYRRAFDNEQIERAIAVTCPVTVVLWSGSIIQPYVARYAERSLPANFSLLKIEGSPDDRLSELQQLIWG